MEMVLLDGKTIWALSVKMHFSYCFFLLAMPLLSKTHATDVPDFFPGINGNLTKIVWAHAVNNQSYLTTTLANDNINMIEADIQLLEFNGKLTPMMGHPPSNQSDLPLSSFLDQIANFDYTDGKSKKGAKLDFKSIEAFEESIEIVKNHDTGAFPLWINADILPGPINSTVEPVNATRFLQGSKSFPNSTLSIGWTTLYGSNYTGSYDGSQVQNMIDIINSNKVTQNITFPVRAGLAAKSKELLLNLTETVENSTLTIWSSEGDNVDVDDLKSLISAMGLNRTYIDVPSDLLAKLDLNGACLNTISSK